MKVGYVRVSSLAQNVSRQTDLMETLGVEKVYIEKISGKDKNRPQLQEMMSYLRDGDELIVESFSRLARNVRDLLEIIETLNKKGVKVISRKENLDTSTTTGKLLLTMIGAIAEFERSIILERQAEGIRSAHKRGKKFGRHPKDFPENWEQVYVKWQKGEIKATEAMKLLELKKTTFYKLVKQYEINK